MFHLGVLFFILVCPWWHNFFFYRIIGRKLPDSDTCDFIPLRVKATHIYGTSPIKVCLHSEAILFRVDECVENRGRDVISQVEVYRPSTANNL